MEDGLTPNTESRGFIGHQSLTLSSTDLGRIVSAKKVLGSNDDIRTRTTEVGLTALAELALSALGGVERDNVITLTIQDFSQNWNECSEVEPVAMYWWRTGLTFVTPSPTDSTCNSMLARSGTGRDQTHNSTTFVTHNHGKCALFEPVSRRSPKWEPCRAHLGIFAATSILVGVADTFLCLSAHESLRGWITEHG